MNIFFPSRRLALESLYWREKSIGRCIDMEKNMSNTLLQISLSCRGNRRAFHHFRVSSSRCSESPVPSHSFSRPPIPFSILFSFPPSLLVFAAFSRNFFLYYWITLSSFFFSASISVAQTFQYPFSFCTTRTIDWERTPSILRWIYF